MSPLPGPEILGIQLWIMQLAVSIFGLVIGSIIAAAGSIIAYRNVYGAAPIYLVTSWGIASKKDEDPANYFVLLMAVEFWNRRKYPVTLQGGAMTFPGLTLRHVYRYVNDKNKLTLSPGDTSMLFMSFRIGDSVKLDPGAHYTFNVEFPFEKSKAESGIDSMAKLVFHYFDPASNRRKKLHGGHHYRFDAHDLPDYVPEELGQAAHFEVNAEI